MNFLFRVQTAVDECETLGMFNWHVQVAIVVYNTLFTPIMGSGSTWGSLRVCPEGLPGTLDFDLFWPPVANCGRIIN